MTRRDFFSGIVAIFSGVTLERTIVEPIWKRWLQKPKLPVSGVEIERRNRPKWIPARTHEADVTGHPDLNGYFQPLHIRWHKLSSTPDMVRPVIIIWPNGKVETVKINEGL